MPVFAAVDIGSNSVRLSIAELRRGRLIPLHQDREVTRLGESVFRDGTLNPQAMAQTLKVLRRFHRAVQSYAVERTRVVGHQRPARQQQRDGSLPNGSRLLPAGSLRSLPDWKRAG